MVGTTDRKGKKKMSSKVKEDDLPQRMIRALIVEDDDRIRKTHRLMFQNLGVETHTVKTGPEAIDKICAEEMYDIIIIQRFLLRMGGIKLTEILRDMDYPAIIVGVAPRCLSELEKDEFVNAGLDLCIGNETPLAARTVKFITRIVPDERETWRKRNFYTPNLGLGPPSGPGSSSSSRND